MRQVIRDLATDAGSGTPIVVLNDREDVDPLFIWHLGQFDGRLTWNGQIDWDKANANREVVCVRYWLDNLTSADQFFRDPNRQVSRCLAEFGNSRPF